MARAAGRQRAGWWRLAAAALAAAAGAGAVEAAATAAAAGPQALALGRDHSCALTEVGGVRCWGGNGAGQLGDGTYVYRTRPGLPVPGFRRGALAVAAGERHSCALGEGGGVWCWGWNAYGQVGDGSQGTLRLLPVRVVDLPPAVAIAAGNDHSCALTSARGVWCWGYNGDGQLGDGSTTTRPRPVQVAGLGGGVAAIAAGWFHTCAVTGGGGARCWGRNDRGQLGDGTIDRRTTPVTVRRLSSGVTAISAGAMHSCALRNDGTPRCWGRNDYGQLGDGSDADRLAPVWVRRLPGAVAQISAGGLHSCARLATGAVRCWGSGARGALGIGSTQTRYVPTQTRRLTAGVAAVRAGDRVSCALLADGSYRCWGNNDMGQLGDGTIGTERLVPVKVKGGAFGPS